MAGRLNEKSLNRLPDGIGRPAYDRASVSVGIVQLGPGAFHRAHQGAYFDRLLELDPTCGVCAVSLKSPGVRDALEPQDGLYTLVTLEETAAFRVLGAIKAVLVASEAAGAVLTLLAAPSTRLVTLTVTEKGYCLTAAGELDLHSADIVHDLDRPAAPASAIGWLVEGLRRRRAADAGPLSVVSCDNLTGNGRKLGAAVRALAAAQGDQALADWIGEAVAFPSSMVDSITPATDDALRDRVRDRLGLEDAWPVQRERFAQWVVEAPLKPNAPDLAACGVQMTADVRPFEQAKLRLLNGAHSSLAYIGRLMGLETVAEAMGEPRLAAFVERLMREDIAASLHPPAELDLNAYVGEILGRFRNPAIRHRLSQIAWDGSQKLPVRLIGPLSEALAAGRPVERLCAPIAAWIAFVVREAQAGNAIVDPLADRLAILARNSGDEPAATVERFLNLAEVFPRAVAEAGAVQTAAAEAYAALVSGNFQRVLG